MDRTLNDKSSKLNNKLVLTATIKFSEPSASSRNRDGSANTDKTQPASNTQDEPIRPFVYRAPTGKAAGSDRSHPQRRNSDADPRGN